ncbi:DUF6950 family protein [Aureimonas glaciei]|uniref:DUF6950 domain-containing protein n=1 Tax=Aureimonas glaciei TaxID=1776957 RepID=A0A916Y498_9HYPH|nr:hypothetical protein [Aureimonas glaciei]GGD30678.1 hypothetical protein GCM10011335_37180 [Aureimonas glaciei]
MTLAEHIRGTAGKTFSLGGYNCARFPAEWVLLRTGRDPLAIFDGLPGWKSQDLIARRRMLAAFARGARSAGLVRINEPVAGDVGVIECAGRHRCAIRGARGWVFFDEHGVSIVDDALTITVAAWSVP